MASRVGILFPNRWQQCYQKLNWIYLKRTYFERERERERDRDREREREREQAYEAEDDMLREKTDIEKERLRSKR